jgi:hypothetical protein
MTDGHRAILILLPLGLAGSGPCVAGTHPAVDPAEFARCARIDAADERLACYDALGRPVKTLPLPAAPASAAADKAPTPEKSSPQAAAGGVHAFGLTRHEAPPPAPPDVVRAQVAVVRTDRLGKVHVRLDNGQVWSFTAADALLRAGEAVTIRRASLGSFLMTTPSHHTYRVQRTE